MAACSTSRKILPNEAVYYAIYSREFDSLTSNQFVRFNGGMGVNPEAMVFTDVTPEDNSDGRYRNPLPTTDGKLVVVHTPTTAAAPSQMRDFRLKLLTADASGRYKSGPSLTGGINKSITYWDPDKLVTFNGLLWELEPVEIVARTAPRAPSAQAMEAPERSVLSEEAVDETALRNWLKTNDLGADRHAQSNITRPCRSFAAVQPAGARRRQDRGSGRGTRV